MAVIQCVEPANETATELHVVDVAAGDDLLFPHVDSCLAMAILLNDNRLLGGHVGVQWDVNAGLEPATNAVRTMQEMLLLRNGAAVSKVVFLGDIAWNAHFAGEPHWDVADPMRPAIPAVKALLPHGVDQIRFLVKGPLDGGVDFVIARAPALAVKVSRFKPPRLKVYDCTLASIIDDRRVDFDDVTDAVGQTCSRCPKVHTPGAATFLGYWHMCRTCNRIFCNMCGKWKLERQVYFERERLCPCGGKTQLVA